MRNRKLTSFKAILISFIFLIVIFHFSFFIFHLDKAEASDLSLGVSPALIKIHSSPGSIVNQELTLQNLSNDSVSLDILLKPFTDSKNQDGEPNYDASNIQTQDFIKTIKIIDKEEVIQEIILSPKQKKILKIQAEIPEKEQSIDHYFSIQFISKDINKFNETNYSQIIGAVSTNVLLSIGERKTQGFIKEFSSPRFLTKRYLVFFLSIVNTGPTYISPQGAISIKNIFGKTVAMQDLPELNILKDSTRKIDVSWDDSFLFGYYTATLNLSISEQGPLFTKSISFFALPTQTILKIFIFALVITLIYKRFKRRILR